jgi:hypothetical protein
MAASMIYPNGVKIFSFVELRDENLPGTWAALETNNTSTRRNTMLWTIAVIMLVLWALGLVTSYTMGGFIHILLVLAIVAVAVRLIQGRRVV